MAWLSLRDSRLLPKQAKRSFFRKRLESWQYRVLYVITTNAIVPSLRANALAFAWQSHLIASCTFCKSLAILLRLLKKLRLCLVLPRKSCDLLAMTGNDEIATLVSLARNDKPTLSYWVSEANEISLLTLTLSYWGFYKKPKYLFLCHFEP